MAENDRSQSSEASTHNVGGELVAPGTLRVDLLAVCGRWTNDLVTKRKPGLPPRPFIAGSERDLGVERFVNPLRLTYSVVFGGVVPGVVEGRGSPPVEIEQPGAPN